MNEQLAQLALASPIVTVAVTIIVTVYNKVKKSNKKWDRQYKRLQLTVKALCEKTGIEYLPKEAEEEEI